MSVTDSSPCSRGECKTLAQTTLDQLSQGGQLAVWSLRRWAAATRARVNMDEALRPLYTQLGCGEASAYLDETLCVLAAGAKRNLQVRCTCSETLSDDEQVVLQALRLAQTEQVQAARAQIERLMIKRLAPVFVRCSCLYGDELTRAHMPIEVEPHLRLVGAP